MLYVVLFVELFILLICILDGFVIIDVMVEDDWVLWMLVKWDFFGDEVVFMEVGINLNDGICCLFEYVVFMEGVFLGLFDFSV